MPAKGKKTKVLFVSPQPFFEVRGTPIANKDMLTILGKHYEIDFISYPIGKDLQLENVRHYKSFSFGFKKVKIGFSLKKLLLDVALLVKTIIVARKKNYDVIHATEEAAYWCSKIANKKGIPFVYDMDSIMSERFADKGWTGIARLMRKIEGGIVRRSDLILGISDNFEPYCKSHSHNCNYVVIWDAPQISERVSLAKKYESLLNTNKKKVLYFGNGEPYQGIELIERSAGDMKSLQFIIAGARPDSKIDNITYISSVPMEMIADLMSKCDVLAAPRKSGTNTPMKVYTYMSSGKPIVATNIEAHNVLEDCGILIEKNEPDFRRGVQLALAEEGKQYGTSAKKKVESKYSFERLETTVMEAYSEL